MPAAKTAGSPHLVTVGHCVYDIRDYVEKFPQPDKTVLLRMPSKVSGGGSAANVAVNACKLGVSAGLISNIGDDRHGKFILEELHSFGVDTKQVKVFPGRTGLSVVLIDKRGEVEVIEDLGVADRVRAIDEKCIANASMLHIAGGSYQMMEAASKIAHKHKIPICFDPGRSASKLGEHKLWKILRRCHYLITNRGEIEGLLGRRGAISDCRYLSKKYRLCVIFKGGRKPTMAFCPGKKEISVPIFKVKPVDTLGAGDAFAGGFVSGIMLGRTLKDCCRLANAAAASKILHAGAQSMPKMEWIRKRFGI
jgi:sugar/nucleoside kinase (ribokinase family)